MYPASLPAPPTSAELSAYWIATAMETLVVESGYGREWGERLGANALSV